MPLIADVAATDGPTFAEIVTEVVTMGQGFAVAPDQVYSLGAACTATDLTVTIDGAQAPGVYEVDDELIRVTAVDSANGVCTVHPAGRGWQGSTATTHAAGALVTGDPVFPRVRVASAVNATVSSLYPAIFGTGSFQVTLSSTWTVELPEEAEFVCDVRRYDSSTSEWKRVRTWEVEHTAADTLTSRGLLVPTLDSGDTVLVVYGLRPQRFATADQRWSDTGLPIGMLDLVETGALSRLVRYLDVGRFTDRSSSPKGDNQLPQPLAGMQLARALATDFKEMKDAEALALRNRYPARQHYTR